MSKSSLTKSSNIYLSTDWSELDSNLDFVFPLRQSIRKLQTVKLLSYTIPWTWPIVSPYTNRIVFVEEKVEKTAVITPGDYSPLELCGAIASAMTTASGGVNVYTCSSSSITYKLTLTASATDFSILPTSTMSQIIGLDTVAELSALKTLTLSRKYDLFPVKEVQIHLPGLVRNVKLALNTPDIAALSEVVSLSGYKPGDLMKNESWGSEFTPDSRVLNAFTISITDQNGYTPEFDINTPLTFLFEITYDD